MGTFTKMLKNTAWFTVGVTAIAVEKAHDGINTIVKEVESGRPQALVRKHCTFIKDKDPSLSDKAKEQLNNIKAKFDSVCTN